jgi:hypothetical protein
MQDPNVMVRLIGGPLGRRRHILLPGDPCLLGGVRCRKPQDCIYNKVEDVGVPPDEDRKQ